MTRDGQPGRAARLWVVAYHYVRRLKGSEFPSIKGLEIDEFRGQLRGLCDMFEMASMESAVEFLAGRYNPRRELCLFTFDDGLKDHYETVLPLLREFGAQGLFGVITACLDEHKVATVHMNHFLTAYGGFQAYSLAFLERLASTAGASAKLEAIGAEEAKEAYPLDELDVARFKLLVNFRIDHRLREQVTRQIFREWLGGEQEFAEQLYMSWAEVCELQSEGMVVAGHTHHHEPLSCQSADRARLDLERSKRILDLRLMPQAIWPFSYPYGRRSSFTDENVDQVRACGFDCAFSTEQGPNGPYADMYRLLRVDCKGVLERVVSA